MVLYFGNILSKHGKSVTMIESLGPRLAEHYTMVMSSSRENKIFRLAEMVLTLLKNRSKAQLILIDCYSSQAFLYVVVISFLARYFKIPYVPILHGGDLPTRLRKSRKISRYVFGRAIVNVSPSKYLYSVFSKEGYSVEYIPNYIEIGEYKFKQRSVMMPKLLWVRSFHSIYNPEMAIEILSTLRHHFGHASLAMVGADKDGSMERCKLLTTEYDLSSSVLFKGYLPKSEWISFSEQYDVFINTTNYDNMPISVIEAMALGLPVVSTNAGGLPYLIDNGVDGMLNNTSDVKGFVTSIKKLLADRNFSQGIAKKAREKVEQLDWNVVGEQWKILIDRESKKKLPLF